MSEKEVMPTLQDVFAAPNTRVGSVVAVEATEMDIAAAVVVLKARAKHYGIPKEVAAYPFRPEYGWRQAALNFIRQNKEQEAKGLPIFV